MRYQKKYILMSDSQIHSMAVLSPCVKNCCLDKQDVCLGCGRTVDEIIRWGDASEDEKLEILAVSAKRKEKRAEIYNRF